VPAFTQFLKSVDLLPLASSRAQVTEQVTWMFLFFFTNFREPWLFASTRRLRTLPLSPDVISLLPMALALISVSALWILLLALHLIVLHTIPASPRSDLFLAFAGLTAIAHSIRVLTAGSGVTRSMLPLAPAAVLLMSIAAVIDYWKTWHPELVQPAMFAGGMALMIAAYGLTRYSLTRTARVYRARAVAMRFQ
jgi:hypothetical protein